METKILTTRIDNENPACPECNNHADSAEWEFISMDSNESKWLCKSCGTEVKDSEFITYSEEA